jgi:hypothetical protein
VAESFYLTKTRDQMLDVRYKADNREQPDGLFQGQRIIGFREWKSGSLGGEPGQWCAIVVLADGTRVWRDEGRE